MMSTREEELKPGDVKPSNPMKRVVECGHYSYLADIDKPCISCQMDMVDFVMRNHYKEFKDWQSERWSR